jgi:hypothetical protein
VTFQHNPPDKYKFFNKYKISGKYIISEKGCELSDEEIRNLVWRFLTTMRTLVTLGTGPLHTLQPDPKRSLAHDTGQVGRGAAHVAKTQFLGLATAISGFCAKALAAVGRWRRLVARSMQYSISFEAKNTADKNIKICIRNITFKTLMLLILVHVYMYIIKYAYKIL